jgi:SPX domain protein involved in polyphosphate accumulation/uncharacterized membrane protein YidH (DUF202 family)
MKFDDYLKDNIDQDLKDYYINYTLLKEHITNIIENKLNCEKYFSICLEDQWNKYTTKLDDLINQIKIKNIERCLAAEIIKINSFWEINQEGFRKILKKHDKNSKIEILPAWKFKILYNPMSEMYSTIRQISDLYNLDECNNLSLDIDSFDRKSIKFWVSKKNVIPLIFEIIKHLPINIYGDDSNDYLYQNITSVYLDNDNMDIYNSRITKNENSKLIRLRWYDNNMRNIFIERKVHHDGWTGDTSSKDRIKLNQSKVFSYLKGSHFVESDLGIEIQNEILSKKIYPIIRTIYKRISFQKKDNNDVRISLDMNLKFIKESITHLEWFTTWDDVSDDDINHFPFCVLEIKLRKDFIDMPPKWIEDIMNSALVIKKEYFSKYCHSAYSFFPNKSKRKPYWIDDVSIPIDNLNTEQINENDSITHKWSCIPKYLKKNNTYESIKIDPKTFFANERTFLQWFNSSIFLGSAGLTLIGLNQKNLAIIVIILACIVIFYAQYTYLKRTYLLNNKISTGYSDLYGPIVLSLFIIITFIFSLIYTD